MIREYVTQQGLVETVMTVEELEALATPKEKTRIMMGQTFDHGQSLDLMKYALFMMTLQDKLRESGNDAQSTWVLADHFMTAINGEVKADDVAANLLRRQAYVEVLNDIYGGNIGVVKSSDLSRTRGYERILERLEEEAVTNAVFKQALLQAVPKDRRHIPSAIQYPIEELATIHALGTGVKVGPVYERHYDEPARNLGKAIGLRSYVAIHLTRSHPLGKPTIPKEKKEEIQRYGVLPYKIGSKGLQAHRIDPTIDSMDRVVKLVRETPNNDPLVDLLTITSQAHIRREGKTEAYQRNIDTARIDIRTLQEAVIETYEQAVYLPMRGRR